MQSRELLHFIRAIVLLLLLSLVPLKDAHAEASCTLANAEPARMEDILKDYRPYRDKCVRLQGVIAFRSFYDSTRAIYEKPELFADPGYIAVYGSADVSPDWLWSLRSAAEVAGTISACELIDTTPTAPDQIVMVIGECHYQESPTIYVTAVKLDPNTPTRLYGPSASRYTTLAQVPAANVKPLIRIRIQRWFQAVAVGDWQQMKGILAWNFDSRDDELKKAVDPRSSPLRRLIGLKHIPAVTYLSNVKDDVQTRSIYGCVCMTSDCEDKWPITEGDTSPRTEWPYVCVEVYWSGEIGF